MVIQSEVDRFLSALDLVRLAVVEGKANEDIARIARAWLPTVEDLLLTGDPKWVTGKGILLEANGQTEDAKRLYRTAADAGDRMGFYNLGRVAPFNEFLEWAIHAMQTNAPAAEHADEWIEGLRAKGIV